MSATDPGSERSRRERLADAIVRRHDEIERRWLERVASHGQRSASGTSELRNSMPEYLLRLAEGLLQEDTAQAGGSSSWETVARRHAETRLQLGFDIHELVQDFILLRHVLFEILEEEGVLYDIRQPLKLADLIEGAIAAAVSSYAESRDYEVRKQHAEHVAFVTHELRSPLSTAALAAAQLRNTLSSSPEHGRILAVIDRSHRRLGELIDGVLRVERGAYALRPVLAAVTMGQILDEPLTAAKLAADAKGIALDVRVDPAVIVQVDLKLTISAIDNVVQNAIKYTDEGEVELVVEESAHELVIHVRDNCPGIAHEDLATIFEPFRRGKSAKPGAGLGLAIARRALEAQGGTIHAASGEPGRPRGCHFWLTLPKPQLSMRDGPMFRPRAARIRSRPGVP